MKKFTLLIPIIALTATLQAIPFEDQVHNLRTKKVLPSEKYSLTLEKLEGEIWNLRANNVPNNTRLQVASRDAFGTVDVNIDFLHVENGLMHSYIDFRDTECYPLVFDTFSIGEHAELLLIDPDKNTTDAISIAPHPLERVGEDGSQLSLKLIEKSPPTFSYSVSNLAPHETVRLVSKSVTEWRELEVTASELGKIAGIITPETLTGKALLEVVREKNSLSIEYEWGKPKKENPPAFVLFTVDRSPTEEEIALARSVFLN